MCCRAAFSSQNKEPVSYHPQLCNSYPATDVELRAQDCVGSMRTLVICSLLAHLVAADSEVEESCASPSPPSTLQSTPCKIKGFETFCKHWNACTRAPAHSVSTPGGRCLYSRMGTLKPEKSLREQTMSGPYSRVTFVAGPDTVSKLAKWHCTPGSRRNSLAAALA